MVIKIHMNHIMRVYDVHAIQEWGMEMLKTTHHIAVCTALLLRFPFVPPNVRFFFFLFIVLLFFAVAPFTLNPLPSFIFFTFFYYYSPLFSLPAPKLN